VSPEWPGHCVIGRLPVPRRVWAAWDNARNWAWYAFHPRRRAEAQIEAVRLDLDDLIAHTIKLATALEVLSQYHVDHPHSPAGSVTS
jgi:hypothetical protein